MPSLRLPPGLLIAATGVGAGDLVLSAITGVNFGTALLWAIPLGALLKYVLNEGLAKWELATGTTLLEGWVEKLPRAVPLYFGGYLIFWAFLVAGTLISYTGEAANAIIPLPFSDKTATLIWGAIQSLLAVGLVHLGGFKLVEGVMSAFIGLMFVLVIGSVFAVGVDWTTVLRGTFFLGGFPEGAGIKDVLALIGGVGGTLTVMCYSYWLRERQSLDTVTLRSVRWDLGVAYLLTAIFSMAVLIIAAGVEPETGSKFGMARNLANRLGEVLGPAGRWAFLVGFWAAVFSSLLGVWSGVPYLFTDLLRRYRARYGGQPITEVGVASWPYRAFLWYLAVPPLVFVFFKRPAFIATAYGVSGALFMPFLAALVLYLNNRKDWVGRYRNGLGSNVLLVLCLLLFLVFFVLKFS